MELAAWLRIFESRAKRRISWSPPEAAELAPRERALIARALATFQLGESSDGRHLQASADRAAALRGQPALARMTALFIREEQEHARLLAQFMARERIPLLRTAGSDRAFRMLRRLAGLELALSILISAELIALTFYPALARASKSASLEQLIALLVEDEELHVAYEAELIETLRRAHAPPLRALARAAQRVVYAAAICVVYCDHRDVLRAAAIGPRAFWNACWRDFRRVASCAAQRVALPA